MPKEHDLKILTRFFWSVWDGSKPFEIRKNDRSFGVGDVLKLREWHPEMGYTGWEVMAEVTYLTDFGMAPGYVCLGVKVPTRGH